MDATALTRIENGQREPRFSEGTVLCRFLGIDGGAYVGAGATVSGAETVAIETYRAAAQAIDELLAGSAEGITSIHALGEVSTDYAKQFPSLSAATGYLLRSIHANAVTKNVIHSDAGPLHTRRWMDNFPDDAVSGAMWILEDLLTLLLDDGTLRKPLQVRIVLEDDQTVRVGDTPAPGTVIKVRDPDGVTVVKTAGERRDADT